jgi:hypothetical protein
MILMIVSDHRLWEIRASFRVCTFVLEIVKALKGNLKGEGINQAIKTWLMPQEHEDTACGRVIATKASPGKCSIITTMSQGKHPVQLSPYSPAPKNYLSTNNSREPRGTTRSSSVSSSIGQQNTGGLPEDFKVNH